MDNLRIILATDDKEWNLIKHFRQKYFFDKTGVQDPYIWTFEHESHRHFVLYIDQSIVGYAHIQLWKDNRAAMRIIVIEETQRNNGLGKKLLEFCENWLKTHNYKTIHAEASPNALTFYMQNGYVEMPFNDPDSYESSVDDIAVGKIL